MGTWGTGPFDSDDAADMVADLMTPIEKVVASKTSRSARWYYQEARAAIQLVLLASGTDILGGPSLVPALEALRRMRADDGWCSCWRSPRRIRAQLTREIAVLERRVERENRVPKRHPFRVAQAKRTKRSRA